MGDDNGQQGKAQIDKIEDQIKQGTIHIGG
jgi:hypothetical protein